MRTSRIHRYVRHGMLPQLAVFEASARLGSFTRAGSCTRPANSFRANRN
jgi:hypothetical protein